jgi:4-hydroxy-3-methylbut-2-en-1-yl diphosphate reductase
VVERVILVAPRGSCAGVVRAITAVERALAAFPPPVYVRRSIVHNEHVLARLTAAGARFVDELDDVPRGAVVVFSAHGVAPAVREAARARDLRVIDATCPLVAKVHREVRRFSREGRDVVLIGHAGHDEVIGTLGQGPSVQLCERAEDVAGLRVADPTRVASVTQTTLSSLDVAPVAEALRRRFPMLVEPAAADICYATRNRQEAVAWLARRVDIVIVVGDRSSSNSVRLVEVARAAGTPAQLIGSVSELGDVRLGGARVVGVTAGASTPDDVVRKVVDAFVRRGAVCEEAILRDERVAFALPPMSLDPGVGPNDARSTRNASPGGH